LASERLAEMENREAASKKVLKAVTKLFPDASIRPLENGVRAFISTGVRNKKHTMRFLFTENGRIYLRKVYTLKVAGIEQPVEVWSQESHLVDRANQLAILNEYAAKIKPDHLTPAFTSVLA
jgi:hypothetical protein